nr:MAG TPA_asm: hypothetical protein [Caudoviricetes sp.]
MVIDEPGHHLSVFVRILFPKPVYYLFFCPVVWHGSVL